MRNNWLSFTIPDDVRAKLNDLAIVLSETYSFNPMTKDDLHMTCVFLGKQFKKKDMDVINQIINAHNFTGEFKFVGLDLFPPNKKNLIVARFEGSNNILKNVLSIKTHIQNTLGYIIDTDQLVPHITLGKLSINKSELSELINSGKVTNTKLSTELNFTINVSQPLYMCGEL